MASLGKLFTWGSRVESLGYWGMVPPIGTNWASHRIGIGLKAGIWPMFTLFNPLNVENPGVSPHVVGKPRALWKCCVPLSPGFLGGGPLKTPGNPIISRVHGEYQQIVSLPPVGDNSLTQGRTNVFCANSRGEEIQKCARCCK